MRTKSRPVMQCDNEGNTINIYESIYMANKYTGVPKALIKKSINGKNVRPYRHLFTWREYND